MNWKIKERTKRKNLIESVNPLIAEILNSRGIVDEREINSFLYPQYDRDIHDPFLFSQMAEAVERIRLANELGERVAIFGDYDADGITSAVILVETLEGLGLDAIVYLPDKKTEGYSMSMKAIQYFKEQNVKLIITVDCGITNVDEVSRAKELGMDVIVTDHHSVPTKLPKALALINPKIENCGYPFRELAGVGVAFKLVQAIYEKLIPEKKNNLKWLLDLVMVGTVADCVPLVGENRVMVKFGLIVMSKTRRVGFREMFTVGRIVIDENNMPDTRKISFQIAPRINAAGRMDHSNLAFNLVREKNPVNARTLALEIEAQNQARQKATSSIVDEIREQAQMIFKDKKYIYAVGENYPIGIVGLAAGKISDEFGKPSMIIQKGETSSRGSLRSISQLNIVEVLRGCSDLLLKFGGHAQAAGLEVENSKLDHFLERFDSLVEERLQGLKIETELEVDLELEEEEIDLNFAQSLKLLGPFGEGNRSPIFLLRNMEIKELKKVGNGEKHLKIYLKSQKTPRIFESISFNHKQQFEELNIGDKIDIVFNLELDEWNGSRKISLVIVDIKQV